VAIPEGSKRLLAYVALHDGPVHRRVVAGTLWPDSEDRRAAGNLRTARWRLRGAGIDIIVQSKQSLALRPGTHVDVDHLRGWSDRVLKGCVGLDERWLPNWGSDGPVLLPGWYDDWVLSERERLRQRMLSALEWISRQQLEAGRYPDAVEAALRAVEIDPLRESAQRALITAHLFDHNVTEARRVYRGYENLLSRELGVAPSRGLTLLMTKGAERRWDEGLGAAVCRHCPLTDL